MRNEKFVSALCLKPLVTQLFRGALRFHHQKFVTRIGQTSEPKNFHRRRRPGLLDRLAAIIEEGFYLAAVVAADKWIADFQCAHLHNHRGRGTSTGFYLRFNDGAAWSGRRGSLEFHHLRLQRHHLKQLIDSSALWLPILDKESFLLPNLPE